jgi:hypothetical protein
MSREQEPAEKEMPEPNLVGGSQQPSRVGKIVTRNVAGGHGIAVKLAQTA